MTSRPQQTFDNRLSRRAVLGAAASAMIAHRATAQSIDPFTYIRAMTTTLDVGQMVGQPVTEVGPVTIDGQVWDACMRLPIKEGQDFHFTCEFDSAWITLMAYGFNVPLEEQLALVGKDESIEPYYEEWADGFHVIGGDIDSFYCGHINENILARARCNAMGKVFEAKGLGVTFTPTRPEIEQALRAGHPVYFKSTVDMLPWKPAVWHTPDGDTFPVVLTNDHALTVMGFNSANVIIRDPLGPTSTNLSRPWQYFVAWERFLEVIAAQGNDAIAISPAPVVPTPAASPPVT